MAYAKTSEIEISKLYDEVKDETENFKKFDLDFFIKNPKRLIILRLILNLNLREFSKVVGCSFSYVSEWENGNKRPSSKTLESILNKLRKEIISKKLKNSRNDVIENFLYFKKMAEGTFSNLESFAYVKRNWYKRMNQSKLQLNSIIGIKNIKRTSEEKEIAKILKKNKIKFEEQSAVLDIGNKAGIIISDFLINMNKCQFIIETSNFRIKKIDFKAKRIVKSRARLLSYKAFRINLYKSQTCKIVAIKMNYNYETMINILREAFDYVVVNDFSKIIEIIRKRRQQDLNLQVLTDTSFRDSPKSLAR